MPMGKKVLYPKNGEIDWGFRAMNIKSYEFENCSGVANDEIAIIEFCSSINKATMDIDYLLYNERLEFVGVAEIVQRRYFRDILSSSSINDFIDYLKVKQQNGVFTMGEILRNREDLEKDYYEYIIKAYNPNLDY